MNDCVFCRIVADHTGDVVMITPLNPVVPGHVIFIPRIHVRNAGEMPFVTAETMRAACTYARTLGVDYNVITSAGPNATQTVFHLHLHVVPRVAGDGLMLPWTRAA